MLLSWYSSRRFSRENALGLPRRVGADGEVQSRVIGETRFVTLLVGRAGQVGPFEITRVRGSDAGEEQRCGARRWRQRHLIAAHESARHVKVARRKCERLVRVIIERRNAAPLHAMRRQQVAARPNRRRA